MFDCLDVSLNSLKFDAAAYAAGGICSDVLPMLTAGAAAGMLWGGIVG